MRKILLISLFLVLLFDIVLNAQSIYEVKRRQDSLGLYSSKVGGFLDYNLNMHSSTDFYGFTLGLKDAIGNFSGTGISVGGFYEFPLNKNMNIQIRGGYYGLNGIFERDETESTWKPDKLINQKLHFSFNANLAAISLEPLFSWEIIKGLNIHAGVNLGALMSSKFTQNEEIMNKYDSIPFEDTDGKYQINNYTDKDIPNASAFQFRISGGLSWDIAISSEFLISPEVFYNQDIMGITSNPSWSVSSIRLGIGGKYIMDRPCPPGMSRNEQGNCEELPCGPGQIRNDDGECICRPGMFVNKNGDCEWPPCPERNFKRNEIGECIQYLLADVKAEPILTTGLPAENDEIELRETESVTEHSILSYVFFDEKSASIPRKYTKFTNDDQVVNYSEDKVGDANDILRTYYNVLNIIGFRLSINPFANVTLQSYNMGGSESNMPELPDRRIDSVSDYLRNVWKIPDFRIKRQVYNLAPEVARSGDKLLIDEYRRVEFLIDTTYSKVVKPVKIKNMVSRLNRMRIDFIYDVMPLTKVDSWKLKIYQEEKVIQEISGKVPPDKDKMPEFSSWFNGASVNKINPEIKSLSYSVEITDRNGETAIATKTMNMTPVKSNPQRKPEDIDSTFRTYHYLFNENDISRDLSKITKFLNEVEFDPVSSKITITGYTDKKGDANTNKLLSEARAKELASLLKEKKGLNPARTSAVGKGYVELFDNSLPEGRLFNRCVIIDISTPMKEKVKVGDLVEGCYVLIYSDEDSLKSKSVLDYLQQKKAKDVYIEKYFMSSLNKNFFRVRSKAYETSDEAFKARAYLGLYLRQLDLKEPPTVKCMKKEEKEQ